MHVVVTGASSGIGEAIAKAYVARGASLTLVARRREPLEALAAAAGPARARVVIADLADVAAPFDWFAEAEAHLGAVDVLVNNAGVQIVKEATQTSWEEALRLLVVDLHAPLRLTQLALASMIPRRSGTIVDVASMAAIAPTPGMFFYNAAKGGLAAASEGLRAEVRRYGVHVVTVYPGPVKTPMEVAGRAAYEPGAAAYAPAGSPETLARLVVRAVERRSPRVVYPRLYGVARHFPNATRWALDALTPKVRALPISGGRSA